MDPVEQLAQDQGGGRMTAPDDAVTEERFPTLWYFLTKCTWADGSLRTCSTLVVDRVPGGFRVVLQDHALWLQKRAVALTWEEVLPALERALADPRIPWEPYKSFRVKTPKAPEKVLPTPSQNGRKKVK